eukprot:COSAG03_NODE_3413_length_2032_cov_1.743404_1_plen_64_part_10
MMALGMQLSRAELNAAMDAMDPDGDNEITFEEFERWYGTQDVGQQVCRMSSYHVVRFTSSENSS